MFKSACRVVRLVFFVCLLVSWSANAGTAGEASAAEPPAKEPAGGPAERPGRSPARTTVPEQNLQIPDEVQACAANLRKISAAIKEYEKAKGKRPDWLSDLVPDYLDKQALLCPGHGQVKAPVWPDPKLPCSYNYEFSPTRLSGNWGAVSDMVCRDWKAHQLKLFGDVVPMVRCTHGSRVMNLSAGGQVYWSSGVWEVLFMPDYRRGDELPPGERPFNYALPAGGVDELLKFIADLRKYRPKTPEQTAEHSRRAPAALKAAATRILTLEKDQWSEAYQTALRVLLEERIRTIATASPDEQRQTVAHVKTFLTAKSEKGIEPQDASLAMSAATGVEYANNHELAAEAYQGFAELIAKSEEEKLTEMAKMMEGAARRLTLLGKEMNVEGTAMDGTPFDWDAYRGKVVLVDFWATESGACRAELPNVKKNYERYHGRGFEVVGISTDRDREALEKFLEKEQLPWVTLHEKDAEGRHPTATYYGVMAIPTVFLVDQEGKVVSLGARGTELDKLLERLLGPSPVPTGKLTYIDIRSQGNARLTDDLSDAEGNNLAELPKGEQTFGGVKFRIDDALIQLAGKQLPERPEKVQGIPVNRKLERLYILHGTGWTPDDGTVIGQYEVNYEDGSVCQIPIVYGEDVRNWWNGDQSKPVTRGSVVWTGGNPAAKEYNLGLRLYLTAWQNPHPDKKVTSIDYSSTNTTDAAPFCVAMTVEAAADTSTD